MIRVVLLTADHCSVLASAIRQSDRDELWASHQLTDMGAALLKGLETSVEAYAGLVDGKPVCAFGVAPAGDGSGVPWMLGTDEIQAHALAFLWGSRPIVQAWSKHWPLLLNYVDARNTASIRWLRWLGFNIMPAEPYGKLGVQFHRFEMRSACVTQH